MWSMLDRLIVSTVTRGALIEQGFAAHYTVMKVRNPHNCILGKLYPIDQNSLKSSKSLFYRKKEISMK